MNMEILVSNPPNLLTILTKFPVFLHFQNLKEDGQEKN
jgi:hypothetical protein